ncbi:MAG: MerR family transcriptional regulator, partial [Gemmatimonadales bacterium]
MKFFSTREAADLLAIPAPRLRAYARVGYITPARGPRRAYRFSFQDLVLLRTAKGLAAARVPSRRINRALRQLVRQLPRGRALSEVRITAEGGRIVVRDGDTAWNPESGQVQLDFSVADLAAKVAPLARRAARAA